MLASVLTSPLGWPRRSYGVRLATAKSSSASPPTHQAHSPRMPTDWNCRGQTDPAIQAAVKADVKLTSQSRAASSSRVAPGGDPRHHGSRSASLSFLSSTTTSAARLSGLLEDDPHDLALQIFLKLRLGVAARRQAVVGAPRADAQHQTNRTSARGRARTRGSPRRSRPARGRAPSRPTRGPRRAPGTAAPRRTPRTLIIASRAPRRPAVASRGAPRAASAARVLPTPGVPVTRMFGRAAPCVRASAPALSRSDLRLRGSVSSAIGSRAAMKLL